MSTYFVNPAGSNTSPYDTPAKGAIRLSQLNGEVVLTNGDIVEVVEGNIAEQTTTIPAGVTIRSYASNTNRPKLDGAATIYLGNNCKMQNMEIGYTLPTTFVPEIRLNGTGIEFSGNLLYCNLTVVGGTVAYDNLNMFNNLFLVGNMTSPIVNFTSAYSVAGAKIVNNTMIDLNLTGSKIGFQFAGILTSSYIVNNIIYGASKITTGFKFLSDASGVTVNYNDVYNVATPYNGKTPGGNSITSNPVLVDPTAVTAAGAKKQTSSPCKDTGATNAIYPGVIPTTDYFVVTRTVPDMGFDEFAATALNTFSAPPERNAVPVTSTISKAALVARIQTHGSDPYFDAEAEIGKVYVTYQHVDGRQKKTIMHFGAGLTGNVSWSTLAKSGVWQKVKVKTIDNDGAENIMGRAEIGTSEDLTLT